MGEVDDFEDHKEVIPPVPGQKFIKLADPPMYKGDQDMFEEFKEKVLLKLKWNANMFPNEAFKVIYIASRLEENAFNQDKKRGSKNLFKSAKEILDYLLKAIGDSDPIRTAEAKLTELK